MLQQCSHPNVVRYFGSYQGEEYLWVGILMLVSGKKIDVKSATYHFILQEAISYSSFLVVCLAIKS